MTELKVLRVKDSALGTISVGNQDYLIESDKERLLVALQETVCLTTPFAAVSLAEDIPMFYWLMTNGIDMSNIYLFQLHTGNFLCKSKVAKETRRSQDIPTVVSVTDDFLEYSVLIRNILISTYKLYYRQERKRFSNVTLRKDIESKMQEYLTEYNTTCGTDYDTLICKSNRRLLKELGDFTDAQIIQLRFLCRRYSKLRNYLTYGQRSSFRLGLNFRNCFWHDTYTLHPLIKGADVGKLSEHKYYTVELYGMFTEARYQTDMTAEEYADKMLGLPNIDGTKGTKYLRAQGISLYDSYKEYSLEINKPEFGDKLYTYNLALAKFLNELTVAMSEAGITLHIIEIGQPVTFAFSNQAAVVKVIEVLHNAFITNPDMACVFEAVSVRIDGERYYEPISSLLAERELVEPYKSRHCAKDFLKYLRN